MFENQITNYKKYFSTKNPGHLVTTFVAVLSRGISAIAQLIILKILVKSLGQDGFAAFGLLTGLVGWFHLADLGFGASIQNHISEARATGDSVNEVLIVGRILCLWMVIIVILMSCILAPTLALFILKAFRELTNDEKIKAFVTISVLAGCYPLCSVIYKIWYAQQKGWLANLVQIGVTILMLAGVFWVQKLKETSKLIYTLAAFLGPATIVPFSILIYQLMLSDLRMVLRSDLRPILYKILKRSAGFNIYALLAAVTLNLDYLVLSQIADTKSLFEYSLISRMMALVITVFGTFLSALWPTISENAARNKWAEVKADLHKAIFYGFAFVIFLTALSPWMFPVVLGVLAPKNGFMVDFWFLLVIGTYQLIRVWTDSFAMILHSTSNIRPFLIIVPVQAIISAVSQIFLVPRYGLVGIYLALIMSFAMTVGWFLPFYTYTAINRNLRSVR